MRHLENRKSVRLIFFSLVFSIGIVSGGSACDVCGCTASFGGNGILPQFNRNFIGLRYWTTRFQHPNLPSSTLNGEQVRYDRMQTASLWARAHLHSRVQAFVEVPFSRNERVYETWQEGISGMGDLKVSAFYQIWRTADSSAKPLRQMLMAGTGITLPTGKYQNRSEKGLLLPHAFQLGSGSTAYDLRVIYTLRYRSIGLNTELYRQWFEPNELSYHPGMRQGISQQLFYWHKSRAKALMPFVGYQLDRASRDKDYGTPLTGTGGQLLRFQAGIDLYIGSWVFGPRADLTLLEEVDQSVPGSRGSFQVQLIRFLGR
jgi:hypothetical protein